MKIKTSITIVVLLAFTIVCSLLVGGVTVDENIVFHDGTDTYTVTTLFTAGDLEILTDEFYINGTLFCDSAYRTNFNTTKTCVPVSPGGPVTPTTKKAKIGGKHK